MRSDRVRGDGGYRINREKGKKKQNAFHVASVAQTRRCGTDMRVWHWHAGVAQTLLSKLRSAFSDAECIEGVAGAGAAGAAGDRL